MNNEQQFPLRDSQMLVEIEWAFLPDEVQNALITAASQLAHETDYIHVQVTYSNVQELCKPRLHAIVPKLEN